MLQQKNLLPGRPSDLRPLSKHRSDPSQSHVHRAISAADQTAENKLLANP